MSTTQTPQDSHAPSADFMDRIEETAFKWGGLVMIFLAVAFAMGIAIDSGLFTPPLRVAGGILVGTALVGVGLVTYLGRPVFGQSLQGVGIAVIFLSVFAGHQMFDVMSFETAMAATVLITGASFWLAARRGDSALAAIGLAGGLAAPFVLTIGDGAQGSGVGSLDNYVMYAATLLVASVAVYFVNGWGSLLTTAGALAAATFATIITSLDPSVDSRLIAQIGVMAVAGALWLVPVVRLLTERPIQVSRHSIDLYWSKFFSGAELGAVVWVPGAAVVATSAIWDLDPVAAGIVSLAAAALVGIVGGIGRLRAPVLGLTHFVAASALLASAFLLILEGPSLQLALAGQAFASLAVGRRSESRVLMAVGGLIALPVAGWATYDLIAAFDSGAPVGGTQLLSHLMIIGFVAAWAALDRDTGARTATAIGAYVLLVVWLAEAFLGERNGQALTTASWIVVAAGASWLGLRLRSRSAVRAGLVTVLAAVAKLFTTDLMALTALGRTGSFFVAGVVLVGFGYKYPAMRQVIGATEDASEPKPFIYSSDAR